MNPFTCALLVFVAGLIIPAASCAEPHIQTVWSVHVDQRLPNSPLALSSPAVVTRDQGSWVVLAGRDRWVHVYDLASGRQVRRFFLGEPSDSGALALWNGQVVLGDIRGNMYAVDPTEGKIVWQKSLASSFTIPPQALGEDFLIQTGDNELYCFSVSGAKRWSFSGAKSTLGLYFGAEPLIQDDIVYAAFNNGDVVALKAYTGDVLWKRQTILSHIAANVSDIKAPLAQPVLLPELNLEGEQVYNALLIPIFQGELVVLSAMDGAQFFDLPISMKSSPLRKGDNLYIADGLGFLHLYNISKGNRVWSKKVSSYALLGPVVFGDALWLADSQGKVFRVRWDGEVEASKPMLGHISRVPIVTDQGLLVRTDRGVLALVK